MPTTIIIESKVQISGWPTPPVVKRRSMQVESFQHFDLEVSGAPLPEDRRPSKPDEQSRHSKSKPSEVTFQPNLTNAKFVAIYDGGHGSGLKVKVANKKLHSLEEPLIFMDQDLARLGENPQIALVNESSKPKRATVLVGSDVPRLVSNKTPAPGTKYTARSNAKPKRESSAKPAPSGPKPEAKRKAVAARRARP